MVGLEEVKCFHNRLFFCLFNYTWNEKRIVFTPFIHRIFVVVFFLQILILYSALSLCFCLNFNYFIKTIERKYDYHSVALILRDYGKTFSQVWHWVVYNSKIFCWCQTFSLVNPKLSLQKINVRTDLLLELWFLCTSPCNNSNSRAFSEVHLKIADSVWLKCFKM